MIFYGFQKTISLFQCSVACDDAVVIIEELTKFFSYVSDRIMNSLRMCTLRYDYYANLCMGVQHIRSKMIIIL
jgi:hypothetical protein